MDNKNSKKIYFIRHPKTVVGSSVCYGVTDYEVAEDVMEATLNQLKEKIRDINFDLYYSSPLSRCKLLAEGLFVNKDIRIDDSIRELNFGSWESLSWDEISIEELKKWGQNLIHYKEHGGECLSDLQQRLLPFWENILAADANNIAIVTHKGVIATLLAHILEANPAKTFMLDLDFGSIVAITVKGKDFFKLQLGF